ncbi:MAG: DNA-binding protein [Anaerolineae bacterium]|nr:DNA-binding protein [Anaerolineae bacterium]
MNIFALRIKPGEDILLALDGFARQHQWQAACVLTCVGSLQKAALRFANREETVVLQGPFEIVSLTGVFSLHGGHYHIAISDGNGRTLGAHLMEGSQVYTTAEIVLVNLPDFQFLRTFDPQTGYAELDIQPYLSKGLNHVS